MTRRRKWNRSWMTGGMVHHVRYADRTDAGRALAAALEHVRPEAPIVLGLPRGGVPVAYEVARALDAPLDVCIVRKLGAPGRVELGIGAVAEGGIVHVDRRLMAKVGVSQEDLVELASVQQAEVAARVRAFRGDVAPLDLAGRTVVLVDDGVATGGTAWAAILTLRARGARRVVLAVPVGASRALDALATVADEIVCPSREDALVAVGLHYDDFSATEDAEVVRLLARAHAERERPSGASVRELRIPLGDVTLEGRLSVPHDAHGLVLFAHGSGSSRHSPRNQYVAGELAAAGLGTLLFDLLTADEERRDAREGRLRFDVAQLASRLVAVTDWVSARPELHALPLAYFGASTGAAAALVAAAERPAVIRAVVSRGGRPDLAQGRLRDVHAPTLLLVGGADPEVLRFNREALDELACVKELEVVPRATHLFEEPGALERVARSATRWLVRHVGAAAPHAAAG